mmetsp:Transcript_45594/g.75792  ORF Transcript_45594/g.75792 Transcript_45594/m.75792 type:complete len:280 (+) Transcript_45594:222-1061(+)
MTTKTEAEDVIAPKPRRPWTVVDHQQLLPNGYVMKWNEGMLKQCYAVGALYHKWIDHPKMRRVRMFDNDIIEAGSFTPWWVVPCLYVPWSLLELDLSYQSFLHPQHATTGVNQQSVVVEYVHEVLRVPFCALAIAIFVIGLLSWTLFEYFVHKHAFHWEPPNSAWNLAHFVGHGMHHLTPTDAYRLLFPPVVSFCIGLTLRVVFYLIFPFGLRSAMFGGFLLGYACYESIHYLAHHCPVGHFLQQRFIHHSAHHFNPHKQDKLFGVSTQIWDVVFNTYA